MQSTASVPRGDREEFVTRRICIGILFMASASACGGGGGDAPTTPGGGNPPPAATVDVFTPGLAFSPAFVTISVGGTVRFNITGVAHDVTFQNVPGAPASIPVTQNAVVSRTFNTKGTFPYDCRTHPGMSGSVTVQ
jgi:plastocyanin